MNTNFGQVRPIDILLIEDNPGDVRLIREALRDGKFLNQLATVPDGQQAMRYLHKQANFAQASRPDLILLDLNLPRNDGREVLGEIKADPDLRRIPVVIITSSQAEEAFLKSCNLHAKCYVTRPWTSLGRLATVEVILLQPWLWEHATARADCPTANCGNCSFRGAQRVGSARQRNGAKRRRNEATGRTGRALTVMRQPGGGPAPHRTLSAESVSQGFADWLSQP